MWTKVLIPKAGDRKKNYETAIWFHEKQNHIWNCSLEGLCKETVRTVNSAFFLCLSTYLHFYLIDKNQILQVSSTYLCNLNSTNKEDKYLIIQNNWRSRLYMSLYRYLHPRLPPVMTNIRKSRLIQKKNPSTCVSCFKIPSEPVTKEKQEFGLRLLNMITFWRPRDLGGDLSIIY